MKAFQFRLDQALRWRATQLDVEKSRTAVAAKRVADIRNALAKLRADLSNSSVQLGPVSNGSALEILSAYTERTRRHIGELEKGVQRAEQDLAAQTQLMLAANRKLHLIENLKRTAQAAWRDEFARELEAFAGETFLGRLQSKKRARSSGG
jgi:flagellar export protein FliJ